MGAVDQGNSHDSDHLATLVYTKYIACMCMTVSFIRERKKQVLTHDYCTQDDTWPESKTNKYSGHWIISCQ